MDIIGCSYHTLKGDWVIGDWDGKYWSITPYPGAKSSFYESWEIKVFHAERIKEPNYQP